MAHTCAPSSGKGSGRGRRKGKRKRELQQDFQSKAATSEGETEREAASARRCPVWSNDSVMAVSTSCVSGGSSSSSSRSGNGSTSTQMPHVCNKRNFRKRQNGVPKIAPLMMSGKRSGRMKGSESRSSSVLHLGAGIDSDIAIDMRGTYPGISSHLDAVIRKVLCDKLAPKAIIDAIRQRFKYILFHIISTYGSQGAWGLLTWSGLCSNQLRLEGTLWNMWNDL